MKRLYQRRWNVELDLRNIKTTLGLNVLSCKTPEMAQKEIWVYLLAYNLIRLVMAQAAVFAQCQPRELSFKHTLQLWIRFSQCHTNIQCDDKFAALLVLVAQQKRANRPGRIEPRAVKRRPEPYPLLTQQRALAREGILKSGHPKKLK